MIKAFYLPVKISVVINTLNEENNIAGCIMSIKDFADEILVCDMHSQDKTVEISRSLGARVIFFEKAGFVEPARYFSIASASYEWILVIDADERMTVKLKEKLLEIANNDEGELILFGILFNYFGGYVYYGGFYNTCYPRFFKKEYYLKTFTESDFQSHQNFRSMEKASGTHIRLNEEYYLLHEAYPTIEKYVSKTVGIYARIKSEELYHTGKRFSLRKLIIFPIRSFIARFIVKKGFRDGIRGFILCIYYSLYIFSIQSNLWFLEQSCGNGEYENIQVQDVVRNTKNE